MKFSVDYWHRASLSNFADPLKECKIHFPVVLSHMNISLDLASTGRVFNLFCFIYVFFTSTLIFPHCSTLWFLLACDSCPIWILIPLMTILSISTFLPTFSSSLPVLFQKICESLTFNFFLCSVVQNWVVSHFAR